MSQQEVFPVAHLDLQRYLGDWFEICRLPMKWEDTTASDITASYSLQEDGRVRVDNRCLDAEGQPTQSIGEAETVGEETSKLTVTFLPEFLRWLPFTKGDYWVLKIDPDYQVSLVGDPDRKFLWLLSRSHILAPEVRQEYLAYAESIGYDLAPLIEPRQSGQKVSDAMLEAAGRAKE